MANPTAAKTAHRRSRSTDLGAKQLADLLKLSEKDNDQKCEERNNKFIAGEIGNDLNEITSEELQKMVTDVNDGRLMKLEKDYSSEFNEMKNSCDKLLEQGRDLATILEQSSRLEKLTRLGMDMKNHTNILMYTARLCIQLKDYDTLGDYITMLSKKRGLLKFSFSKMISLVCIEVKSIDDEKVRDKLVETLRNVTAGKIYVEIHRARLTRLVSQRLEREGKLDEAWNIMMELQVETFGSMEMDEKVNYLMEQMRLSILKGEWIRALVISRKINRSFFDQDDAMGVIHNLKVIYFNYMIQISLNDGEYLEVARHYLEIFKTPELKDSVEQVHLLKCAALYTLLAQHSNEQWDLLHRIAEIKKFKEIPVYGALVKLFTKEELVNYKTNFLPDFEKALRVGIPNCEVTAVFENTEKGEKRWNDFKIRMGEHNLRMVAKYYSKITFARLANLMDCSEDEMETFLCDLIVSGVIPHAKIDRPKKVISLKAPVDNLGVLDSWASDVNKLTGLLNNISHLILKEEMIHKNYVEKSTYF
uniref:PCI domain-containing protein n=1 Tax=Rhabditophanes sp. KR3021 TaxID=114890 RepID=A0AC35TRR8_9BILA